MSKLSYDKELTALLVVDPYNDFISEGGKLWDRVKPVATANDCIPNMIAVLDASRRAGLRVFYALHHRYRPGDYESWKYIAPIQTRTWHRKTFEAGTWGGEIRKGLEPHDGDVVALEHWCSSGFANTDLDQQLKVHGIHRLIVIGLLANTCIEATVRFAAELGYDVTVVRDAIAALSEDEMHAALEINLPNYANAIVPTTEIVNALQDAPPTHERTSDRSVRTPSLSISMRGVPKGVR
jgi:ureidoacrylate peracid hydrolase